MIVPATLARTGVQVYRNADGSVRRELRLPEDVFHEDALASLALVPVTKGHPPVMLDSTNTDQYAKGAVGENVSRDGKFVKARLLVTDADTIAAIESGDASECSVGYRCDLEMASGVYEGQRYDAIQRNIRANHVSVVAKGRAGADVRIHLDAAEADINEVPTVLITINGKKFDVSDEAAEAYKAELAAKEAAHAEALSKVTARADSAEAEAKALKAERKDAAEQAKQLADAVKARRELERKAEKLIGSADKFDTMDDAALMRAAIAKARPTLKLDGKDATYVQTVFDLAVNDAEEAPSGDLGRDRPEGESRTDQKDPLATFKAEQEGNWLKPIKEIK